MRRTILGAVAGLIVAIPMGYGVAALAADDISPGVPASDCPEAVAKMKELGIEPADSFVPKCPDPADMELDSAMSPSAVVAADRACNEYSEQPAWCPTPNEVKAARDEGGK